MSPLPQLSQVPEPLGVTTGKLDLPPTAANHSQRHETFPFLPGCKPRVCLQQRGQPEAKLPPPPPSPGHKLGPLAYFLVKAHYLSFTSKLAFHTILKAAPPLL